MATEKKVGNGVMRVVRGDITDMELEGFVYDIMEDAKLGTGYGTAIMARAGKKVQDELDAIGSCPKGEAIVTSAGRMKTKHIIHVNGPKFHENNQEGILKSVVAKALAIAEEKGLKQLAFPPIGTGFYQVDLGLCSEVLVDTVSEHLKGDAGLSEVLFVALDSREFAPLRNKLEQGG